MLSTLRDSDIEFTDDECNYIKEIIVPFARHYSSLQTENEKELAIAKAIVAIERALNLKGEDNAPIEASPTGGNIRFS